MGPRTKELVELMESAITQLCLVKEHAWADALKNCLSAIKSGDFYGVERFIKYFGGMASLNDLVIHPMNGHSVKEEDVNIVNSNLRSDLERAYSLAIQIKSEN